MAFGQSLKSLLEERGIKQNELAKKIGVSESTLSSMINRDVGKVDINVFLDICDAIGCDPDEFYRDYKKKKQKPAELTGDECRLLDLFRQLTPVEKGIILGRAEQLAEAHERAFSEDAV